MLARFLSRFDFFKGSDNPYYGITLPPKLRLPRMLIEFSSILPHYLLRKFLSIPTDDCRSQSPRLIAWIIVTLDHPRFPNSLLGAFLAGLAFMGTAIYVTADPNALRKRAPNTPYSFLLGESACYDVLTKYYASHTIDTILRAASRSWLSSTSFCWAS